MVGNSRKRLRASRYTQDMPPIRKSEPKPPVLPHAEQRDAFELSHLRASDMLEDVTIAGQHEAGMSAERVSVAGALVSDCSIPGANLESIRLVDVRAERVDWSNTIMTAGTWARVAMTDCKLMGLQLNHGRLDDVVLTSCIGDLAQFQDVRFRRARFERCRLSGAFFNDALLTGTVFQDCDLREVDFSNAVLTGVDLRGCQIEDIRVAPAQLAGVKVTPDQALYLASLMGLVIE